MSVNISSSTLPGFHKTAVKTEVHSREFVSVIFPPFGKNLSPPKFSDTPYTLIEGEVLEKIMDGNLKTNYSAKFGPESSIIEDGAPVNFSADIFP